MPLVTGDLRTVLIVDTCVFGAAALVFGWRYLRTHRLHLVTLLSYAFLANLARSILGFMLLWDFSRRLRLPDAVEVYWLRWVFYLAIWGLSGITHFYAEYSCQAQYFYRWILSLTTLGIAFLGPLVATLSGYEDQRIVAFALAALPFLFGVWFLFAWNYNKHVVSWVILAGVVLSVSATAVIFALGHAMWRIIPLVAETYAYTIIDSVVMVFWPALAMIFYCPCVRSAALAIEQHHHSATVEESQQMLAAPLPIQQQQMVSSSVGAAAQPPTASRFATYPNYPQAVISRVQSASGGTLRME